MSPTQDQIKSNSEDLAPGFGYTAEGEKTEEIVLFVHLFQFFFIPSINSRYIFRSPFGKNITQSNVYSYVYYSKVSLYAMILILDCNINISIYMYIYIYIYIYICIYLMKDICEYNK